MANISSELRDEVLKSSDHQCEYCRTPERYSGIPLEVDHIIPQSVGGLTEADNLCSACRTCNNAKRTAQTGIDPETDGEVSLFNPRTEKWSEHFAWSKDNPATITGLTATGRATIQRLRMNNKIIVIARSAWRKAGWTPPTD